MEVRLLGNTWPLRQCLAGFDGETGEDGAFVRKASMLTGGEAMNEELTTLASAVQGAVYVLEIDSEVPPEVRSRVGQLLSWKGRAFFCGGSACTWGRRLPGMVPGHWWHCLKGPRVQERPIMCTVLAWTSLLGQETRHCSWSITSYSIKGYQCSILETILLIKLALVGSVSCVDFQVRSHRFRFLEPWSGKAWGLPSPRGIVANWNLYAARWRVPNTWNR